MDIFAKVLKRIKNQQLALVIVLLLGSVFIIFGVIWQSYKSQSKLYRTEKLNYLNAIVKTVAPQIDGDEYQSLLVGQSDVSPKDSLSPYFSEMRRLFNSVKKSNRLSTEIYTLSKLDGSDSLLYLIINSGDSVYFKNKYHAPEPLIGLFETGGTLGPYTDSHGTWLSAFTPIKNSDGKVVGSVQADISWIEFQKNLRAEIISELKITGLALIGVIVVLIFIAKSRVNSINRLQKTFADLSHTVADKNHALRTAKAQIENRKNELEQLNNRLEDLVALRTEEVEAKKEELQQFFYHASHKMKSPIVNILGLVELSRIIGAEGAHSDSFDKIGRLAKRTIRLLDQLNKASYNNIGQKETIYLGPFIDGCAKDSPHKGCVEINAQCNQVPFQTNPYLLQVVFDALLENAIFFSRKHKGDDARVWINCVVDEKGLNATITDNGPGIPEEFMEKICEMFFIGSNLSKGSGLGLYLAQQAAMKIGGTLSFTADEKGLTIANIYVPN